MSDIIRLLPDSVANQIAAGEVVQRPASVVKELVENAIDAGATLVNILLKDHGRTLIQVIDNGKGMSVTDARMAFERHATSKIQSAGDLFNLNTLGFRGEALASIAAVSQIELRTRRKEDELGALIAIAASQIEKQEVIVTPEGSNFAIKNIFFNVPARRKFLKTPQVELSNIVHEVERIALVHPEVAFVLRNNDSEILNLPLSGVRQRIVNIFGKGLNQQLLSVDVATTVVKVSGFVGKPEAARKKNAIQFFFVNGRYMRHPYFHRAVMQCYESLLAEGEMPNYFLYLDVDPATIDVNIHPTKTEIKFEDEIVIYQILLAAIKEALGKFSAVPSIDFDQEGALDIPAFTSKQDINMPKVNFDQSYDPFASKPITNSPFQRSSSSVKSSIDNHSAPAYKSRINQLPEADDTILSAIAPQTIESGISGNMDFLSSKQEIIIESEPQTIDLSPMVESLPIVESKLFAETQEPIISEKDILLHTSGKYIVAVVNGGIMLIDHHRAHIQILFEEFIERISEHRGASQRVLFPEVIQFSHSDAILISDILEELYHLGFDLADLGGGSFSVNGIPSEAEGKSVEEMLNKILTSIRDGYTSAAQEEVNSRLSLSLAESASIPYGKKLTQEEMQSIVSRLFMCNTHNHTPDGKTIIQNITTDEVDKRFK